MNSAEVDGLFALAGISVSKKWRLPNGYYGLADVHPDLQAPSIYIEGQTLLTRRQLDFLNWAIYAHRHPWWLVQTPVGLVEIGWRKRVIHIDWSGTPVRFSAFPITKDDVTKSPTSVHAWTEEKALEYLKALAPYVKAVQISGTSEERRSS